MEFGGRYLLQAPRLQVWAALNDTEILRRTIPGCRRIQWVSETELEAVISVNLGVAQPTLVGDLELIDIEPAVRYTLAGKGRGGVLGRAQGSADITLDDHGEDTILEFTASGGASGQIMRVGKKVIGAGAQGVIDGFFSRFAEAMGAEIKPLKDI